MISKSFEILLRDFAKQREENVEKHIYHVLEALLNLKISYS